MMTVDSSDRVGSVDRRDGITSCVSTLGLTPPRPHHQSGSVSADGAIVSPLSGVM